MDERRKFAAFHMLMQNNFMNFYGKVIYEDLEEIKKQQLIEDLEIDFLNPPLSIEKNGYFTLDYYWKKFYSLPTK